MFGWRQYRKDVKARVGDLGQLTPDFVKSYVALGGATDKAVHLDKKTRELIALAVAVTTRCDGCIASHVEAAIAAGTTKQEIAEALNVAIALNAGAALVYTARTLDCFDEMSAA